MKIQTERDLGEKTVAGQSHHAKAEEGGDDVQNAACRRDQHAAEGRPVFHIPAKQRKRRERRESHGEKRCHEQAGRGNDRTGRDVVVRVAAGEPNSYRNARESHQWRRDDCAEQRGRQNLLFHIAIIFAAGRGQFQFRDRRVAEIHERQIGDHVAQEQPHAILLPSERLR